MKVRKGFVSNSSSSSFTCGVCEEIFSGWDIGYEDVDIRECTNHHIFCDSHAMASEQELSEYDAKNDTNYSSARYTTDPKFCPMCNLKELDTHDELRYLRKLCNLITRGKVLDKINGQFKTFQDFDNYLKEKSTNENT